MRPSQGTNSSVGPKTDYRFVFDHAPYPVSLTSAVDGRYLDVNAEFERRFGRPRAEVIGKTAAELGILPAGLEFEGFHVEIVRSGGFVERVFPARSAAGELVYWMASASIVPYGDGEAILAFTIDVTKAVVSENSLRKKEEQLQEIAARFPGVIFEFFADEQGNWGSHYVSERARDILGLEPDAPDHFARFRDGIVPEHREAFRESIEVAVRHRREWRFEGQFRRPDGQVIWLSGQSTSMARERELVFHGVLLDVTERKGAESALRLEEMRLEALLRLDQMQDRSLQEITDFALEEAVRLTQSELGYLAFVNEAEDVLTMHSWSRTAMAECAVIDRTVTYPLATTGLWGEAVRQRRPIVTNDYAAPNPWKKGVPPGHVRVRNHLNVPVFDGERVVVVAGVGNKREPYDESDVRELTLLMQGMWRLVQRQRQQEDVRKNEMRLEAILRISQSAHLDEGALLDTALEEALRLTESPIGYFYYYDERRRQFLLHDWSPGVMQACAIVERQTIYELDKTGLWGEAVRQRRPILVNDYAAPSPLKKGCPAGHSPLRRFLTTPVFQDDRIVAVVGVGNKEQEYRPIDVLQLSLLMDSIWKQVVRRRAEEALREANERLHKVLDYIPQFVCWKDRNSVFVGCNRNYARMIGLADPEQIVGKTDWDLPWKPEETEFFLAHDRRVMASDRPELHIVEPALDADGRQRWLDTSKIPLHDAAGAVIGLLVSFDDITERQRAQEELRQSEAKYKALIETTQTGFVILDEAGGVIDANLEYVRLTGRADHAEVIGHNVTEWTSPDDRERNRLEVARCLERGCVRGLVVEYVDDHGRRTPVEVNATVLGTEGPVRILSLVRDVAERTRAEQALRESEERFRRVFVQGPYGMVIVDVNGKYLHANPAFCEFVGYAEDELRQLSFLDITHPDTAARDSWGMQRLLAGEIPAYQTEKRYVHKSGEARDAALTVTLIRNPAGKPPHFVSIIEDVRERKRAEAALRASEERFRALIENSKEGVIVLGASARALYANPVAQHMLGYDETALRRLDPFALIHPDDRPAAIAAFGEVSATPGSSRELVLRLTRGDGALVHLDVVGANCFDVPGVEGLVCNFRDVTAGVREAEERARLEEQLAQATKMEAIGRLAGGVAHDFNNLLTGIMGNLSLALADLSPGDPVREALSEALRGANSAAELTRQLLTFSRKQLVAPSVLNLNAVAERLERMLVRLIGEDIELKFVRDPALGQVNADLGQIEQILVNLVVNARDALPDGGRVTLETANVDLDDEYGRSHTNVRPGLYVMLAVSDNGLGMSEEVKARLFEPFFTTKEKGKGTGLGLSTVYGAVKQNDGHIAVYSELGQGTTFKVYLPRVHAPAAPLVPAAEADIPGGTETVVLVEDEEIVRTLAERLLKRQGYTVLAYPNAAEAWRAIQGLAEPIHLLMTDVVMPGESGKALAERVKALRPEIGVLYTSGYTENAIAHHGVLEEGINFIGKPYSPAALARKVREVLSRTKTGR